MTVPSDWTTVISALLAPEGTDPADRASLLKDALGLGSTITADSAGCSVTEATDTGFRTPAASTDLALQLDLAQYAAGDGPCVAACRDLRPHAVTVIDAEPGYPGFTAAALERGVHSSLSLPLPGARRPAALNLYATSPSAFHDPRALRIAALLARCVATVLPEHVHTGDMRPVGLAEAQARHDRVRRAQRTLSATREITPDDALSWLMHRSRTEHCSIFTIVDDVLGDEDTAPTVDGGGR